MKRTILMTVTAAAVAGVVSFFVTRYAVDRMADGGSSCAAVYDSQNPRVTNVSISGEYPDFTYAAEESVKAVVFVKVIKRGEERNDPSSLFEYFFGFGGGGMGRPQEQVGSGSGVIIKEDGYILTNNHVIAGADEIEVTTDNDRVYKAELIGTDPATDVALIKIDAEGLPVIPMGDSDGLRLGEWVLAIGSPYGLTSTITAGIVSAKGRSMAPNGEFKIESFIQTDAAVNPGNSGGALVNIKGELVGINTAIISQTGSYTGYSFAVPVNMAKKVVEDLLDYGTVQRGLLGISMLNNSESLAKEKKLSSIEGVYIAEVVKGGAAETAGVKEGDVLISVNGTKVKNGSAVQEIINRFRPGDEVTLGIVRGNDTKEIRAVLLGKDAVAAKSGEKVSVFGAGLASASRDELKRLGLKSGVQVVSLENGKMKEAGIRKGFIITFVDNSPVFTPSDVAAAVKSAKRAMMLEGYYPDGTRCFYGVGIR